MYTAKEIDRMSIEELEELTCYLSEEQKIKWSAMGYDGKTFVELTKEQSLFEFWKLKSKLYIHGISLKRKNQHT